MHWSRSCTWLHLAAHADASWRQKSPKLALDSCPSRMHWSRSCTKPANTVTPSYLTKTIRQDNITPSKIGKKWKTKTASRFQIFDRFRPIFYDFEKIIFSICFWKFYFCVQKSSTLCQKRRFWRKRTSQTWFSWRDHPDWYRRNRFSIHGDPFSDFVYDSLIFCHNTVTPSCLS